MIPRAAHPLPRTAASGSLAKAAVRLATVAAVIAACSVDATTPADETPLLACERTEGLPDEIDLAEASGAAWVSGGAGVGFLVVSDQGHDGDAALVSPATLEASGMDLPLDGGASDDLEGLSAAPDGRVVGITSSGHVRAWSFDGDEPRLELLSKAVSEDPEWACDEALESNCGADFEGICLDPHPTGPCAGYAASKAKGDLVCLVPDGSGYALWPDLRIEVTKKGRLSDCAYELDPPHRLVAAGNLQALSALWQVRGHRDPARADVSPLGLTGAEGQEAIAFGPGGLLASFGDPGEGGPKDSPAVLYSCE